MRFNGENFMGGHQYFQVHQQHLHQSHQDGTLKMTYTRSSGLMGI